VLARFPGLLRKPISVSLAHSQLANAVRKRQYHLMPLFDQPFRCVQSRIGSPLSCRNKRRRRLAGRLPFRIGLLIVSRRVFVQTTPTARRQLETFLDSTAVDPDRLRFPEHNPGQCRSWETPDGILLFDCPRSILASDDVTGPPTRDPHNLFTVAKIVDLRRPWFRRFVGYKKSDEPRKLALARFSF
jgi:hypothetical protein